MQQSTTKRDFKIQKIFNRLVYAGYEIAGTTEEKRALVVVNILALLTGFLVFTIGLLFYSLVYSKPLLYGVIIESSAFFFLVYLNKIGQRFYANTGMIIIHCFSAVYMGALLGVVLTIDLVAAFLIFFLVAGATFFVQSSRLRKIILVVIAGVLGIIEANNYFQLISPIPVVGLNYYVFRWFSIGGMMVLILVLSFLLVREHNFLFSLLKTANGKLKTADANRRKFLREIVHDLKTPIASIHAAVQRLKYNSPVISNDSAEIDEMLNTVVPATVFATNLIKNILNMSKLEEGIVPSITPSKFHTYRWLLDILEVISPLAAEKEQRLIIGSDRSEYPATLVTDKLLLSQIIMNLAVNAVNYAPSGSVITFHLCGTSQNGLLIQVINSGPAIPLEIQESIFMPFVTSNNTFGGGTGLGLQITKELVARLGGSITLQSSSETVFSINLPEINAELNPQQAEQVVKPDMMMVKLSGMKILTIDDQEIMHKFVSCVFPDCMLFSAENGLEGLKCARTFRPDLILLDSNMPGMNGMDVLKIIKNDERLRNTPVILTSADAFMETEEYLAAGADDFVKKPIEVEELNAVISRLI